MDGMRSLLIALLLSLAVLPASVGADQTRMPRIGVLTAGSPPPPNSVSPFVQQLNDLGWVRGQTVEIHAKHADGRLDRLPKLADELVKLEVDVIVAFGATIRPAAAATRTIPIVMVLGSADPVRDGLVQSLAHPGTNVTGITWSAGAQLLGRNLQTLKEMLPGLSRVALLWDGVAGEAFIRAWEDASQQLGVKAEWHLVREPTELEPAIATIGKTRPDVMYVGMGGITFSSRERVAALALTHRMPTFAIFRQLPEAGGLLSYGPSLAALHRRGAIYVDRILKGTKPSELPIEQPTTFELVVNLKTAKLLGLVVPQSILVNVDEAIR
jgi:putative ABC transport system substrate-binding protein